MTKSRRLRLGAATATALALVGALAAAPAGAASYGLAGLWLFDEGHGQQVVDMSGNGLNGQLGTTPGVDANDPTWIVGPPLFGRQGSALRFDGEDMVRVPNAPALEPDGVTVAGRVRAAGSPGSSRYLIAKGALGCNLASYGLFTGTGGTLQFYVSDGSAVTLSPAAAASIWDGTWHTVIGSFDGRHVTLVVDGRKVGSTRTRAPIGYGLPQSDGLYLGSFGGDCAQVPGFVGDLDAVAIVGKYSSSVGHLVGQR